jgi:glycosyltransferase 2 family protein
MNELAIKDTAAPSVRGDRSKGFFYLRLAFGVLLLAALFRMLDLNRLGLTLASVKPQLLALGLGTIMVNLLIKTYRWGFILRMQRPDISFGQIARVNFLSLFLGSFLPTSLSYDVVRIYYVSRRAADPRVAISSIFADRIIGNFSVAMTAIVVFAILNITGLFRVGPLLSFGIIIFLLVSLALPLVLWNSAVARGAATFLNRFTGRRIFDGVQELSEYLLWYWRQAPQMSRALAIAFLNLAIAALEFYLIAQAFSAPVLIRYFFLFIPLVVLFSMLPVSIGGIGLVEAGLMFFFINVGMPAETCLSVALIHRALQIMCLLPGAAIYMCEGDPRASTREASRPMAPSRTGTGF